MIEMFDDRIDITNFGGLAKGLNPEDFGKKNGRIFKKIGYFIE